MSLKPEAIPPVPEETARVAMAAFPDGSPIMRLRDALGALYDDELFADLFPRRGQPAEAPWRLALVKVFQFMEDLSERNKACQNAHFALCRTCPGWLGYSMLDFANGIKNMVTPKKKNIKSTVCSQEFVSSLVHIGSSSIWGRPLTDGGRVA